MTSAGAWPVELSVSEGVGTLASETEERQVESLQQAVDSRNIVFVVGAGVSASITNNASTATWIGLIESARDRVAVLDSSLDDNWRKLVSSTLEYAANNGDTASLVTAASMVTVKLRAIGTQATADWLSDDVGRLPIHHREIATALLKLPYPILTTNYDSLLEKIGGRQSACWTESRSIQQVLAGTSNAIGHIHGVWSEPESVVLSEGDYAKLLVSEAAQDLQRAASSIKSVVYVGFGSGLNDPNFASLLTWHRETFNQSGVRHFRLCRSTELDELRRIHKADNIEPVAYGDNFEDLPRFLSTLAPDQNGLELTRAGIARDVVAEAQQSLAEDLKADLVIAEEVSEDRDLNELILRPILLPVPYADYVKARSAMNNSERIERLDPVNETREADLVLLVAEEGSGLTTALKWMAWQASLYLSGAAPIYVNFQHCRKGPKPLDDQLRQAARAAGILQGKKTRLPPYILALDDLNPYVPRISDRVLEALADNAAVFTVIGCKQSHEEDLLERLRQAGLQPRVRYLGRLNSADITELAKIAAPSRYKEVAQSVVGILSSESLPHTPFTASLLISILLRGDSLVSSASQTAVLDQYVSLLLGRGDPHEDARFIVDQAGREILLANLAQHFVQLSKLALSEAEVVEFFDSIFTRFGWSESPTAMLTNFIDRRVLKRVGPHVQFSRTSYLYLFAAKRALADADFLSNLTEHKLYYSPILMPYAALARNDGLFLERVATLLDEASIEVMGKGSPYQELPLVSPPEHINDEEHDSEEGTTSGTSDSEVTHGADLLDFSDVDAPSFLGAPDNDLPPTARLIRTLELVSTVLRDSDQIEDLTLKRDVLVRTLETWGNLISVLSSDRSFQDLIERLTGELEKSGLESTSASGESRRDFMDELARTIPASVALGGIEATLASRKLLTILASALNEDDLAKNEETMVGAVLLIYSLAEPGWPMQLRNLLARQGNIWIVRNFVFWLCLLAFTNQKMRKEDEADLIELCVEIVERGTRYSSHQEKVRSLDYLRHNIKKLRLRQMKSLN